MEDGFVPVWQRVPFRLELSWEFQRWMAKHGQQSKTKAMSANLKLLKRFFEHLV
jgi:hypothetical protein